MNKNQTGFSHLAALLMVVSLGAVGAAGWRVMDQNRSDESTQSQPLLSQGVLPAQIDDIKLLDEILAVAQPEIGGREVMQIVLNQEGTSLVYQFKLSGGSVLVYDAKTGEKLSISLSDDDNEADEDGDSSLPVDYSPSISMQDALAKAKSEHPGFDVRKVELEVEDGIVVFSVRFVDKFRVDIDATEGNVLRIKSPEGPDVKLKDDDRDIDDDGQSNDEDEDDDNNGVRNQDDDDDEGDGVTDDRDDDDDNDGEKDSDDDAEDDRSGDRDEDDDRNESADDEDDRDDRDGNSNSGSGNGNN